jgi:hypothetical protein
MKDMYAAGGRPSGCRRGPGVVRERCQVPQGQPRWRRQHQPGHRADVEHRAQRQDGRARLHEPVD